jgi:hypothetical protein
MFRARVHAGARDSRREGLPAAADLRDTDWVSSKPRRARRIARAIPLGPGLKSESRVSAKPRNPANEMRFPVSREDGGNASARCRQSAEVAAGSPSRTERGALPACAPARLCASRDLSSLALRSPVKSHSAARAAGTAIALCPGLRSICLPLTRVGSVERSPREIPRRATRRHTRAPI